MLKEAYKKIVNFLNNDFTMLWATIFYGSIIVAVLIEFAGQYAIFFLTVAFVATDVSLTYRSFYLISEKHPEVDKKVFYTLEMNPAVKFMVSRFGLVIGGLSYVAFCTMVMALILSSASPMGIGLFMGMYFLIIFTHLENIRYFNGLEPARNGQKHLARCCQWAERKP